MPKTRPFVPQGEWVLNKNWDRQYRNSMSFPEVCKAFKDPAYHWPLEWHKLNGKICHDTVLCFQAGVTEGILQEHHATTGHCGIEALLL